MKKQTTNTGIQKLATIAIMSAALGLNINIAQAQVESKKTSHQEQTSMIETDKILIKEKPQSVYTLELKDGKPFNGYEVTEEKLLGEFAFVNYYENGNLKIKYAVDFIAKDQYEAPFEYTLKTTYANGKVITGNVYHQEKNGFLRTDQYTEGEKTGFTIDIFAMHYFNRIIFKIDDNQLVIKTINSKDEVKIHKKDEWVVADYYIDGVKQQQSKPVLLKVEEGTPNSNAVFYYDKAGNLRQCNMIANQEHTPLSNNDLLFKFYAQFSFEYTGELKQLLEIVEQYFRDSPKNTEQPIETIFEQVAIPYTQETLLSYVSFDHAGQPQSAVLFRNTDNERYHQFTEVNEEITNPTIINKLLEVLKEDIGR